MLRTLVYRQAFFVLDVLLIGLIACVGFFGVKNVMAERSPISGPEIVTADVQPAPTVGDLASYEPIVANKFFGDPPAVPVAPAETTPVVDETPQQTELPLTLGGTIVAGAVSSAIIYDNSRRLSDVYYLNQQIIPNVTLLEVRKDAVVIDNAGKREILARDGEDGEAIAANVARPPQLPPAARQTAANVQDMNGAKVVNRQEVMRELSQNAAKLLTEVKPEFKKDAQGNTIGVTSSNISAIPMAKEVGLQDNDVVTSINGELIDSEAKLSQLLQKYGNATTVRVGIQRNGRPQVLTLRLE